MMAHSTDTSGTYSKYTPIETTNGTYSKYRHIHVLKTRIRYSKYT
jgi:hypothetical protein